MEQSPSLAATPLVLTIDEAAKTARISRRHLQYLIANGQLRVTRLGRRTLIPYIALKEMLAA